ncbi:hypothetical protein CLU93_1869 [Janthinobacterium sp. 35]|uniref:hypothetical protein n=1 Tax=Janthinobacterium sp. 35 TaxID=2035210 RepID=UPI000C639BF0|nr:hypothetical protein [Janthinobacterium sp. 35]PIG27615.1 hypothetical protein CLU93_1869 [Janthinobacterium sp. 35]
MLRVISPHLIVAASTALLPRGADAAVYLNVNMSVRVTCTTRYLSGTGARYLHS